MRNFSVPIILIASWLTLASCTQFNHDPASLNDNLDNSLLGYDADNEIDNDSNSADKRSERYAFGLGRRAYHYTSGGSGVKRLPVYNFGLGKRARPYSFGLGKRVDAGDNNNEYPEVDNGNNEEIFGLTSSYNRMQRNRPYSFGLGKRDSTVNVMERRVPQGSLYNFGLGKRDFTETKLDKRVPHRDFNFGMGRR